MTQTKRLRKIQKWDNTLVIVLTKLDQKDLNLDIGDDVDISLLKKEGKQNEN